MDDTDGSKFDRRTVLSGVGTLAVAGLLAGCGGDGGDGGDGGSDGEDGGDGGSDGGDGGDGGSDGEDGGGGDVPSEVEEYLSDDETYDGVEDMTGESEVTVMCGAEGNGGGYAFDPSAIRVDSGTAVVWEWTGEGGAHNVLDEETGGDMLESELTEEEGYTYEHTFEESGTHLYYCQPHKALGMKGAVIVE
jgi:halocyanin-like protein